MCVILACKSKKPTLEILEQCEKSNKHGGGFMCWTKDEGGNDKVWYKKGLDAKEIFDLSLTKELPFIIHFRWASNGGTDKLLTHPFEVTPESELRLENVCDKALMHNGHFTDWKICLFAAGFSEPIGLNNDSRSIARIISKDNLSFLKKINGYFVVADSSVRFFRMYGDFKESDGIYYSNFTWKYGKTSCSGYPVDKVSSMFPAPVTQDCRVALSGKNGGEEHSISTKVQKKTFTDTDNLKVNVKQIVIPKLDGNKKFNQDYLRDVFLSICPSNLSKKQSKKLWRRFCNQNELHFLSFKNNVLDILDTNIQKNQLSNFSLTPEKKTPLITDVANPT